MFIAQADYHKSSSLSSPHIGAGFLFLMMRTFKVYSLSNFQMYNTILLIMVTMLYIRSL